MVLCCAAIAMAAPSASRADRALMAQDYDTVGDQFANLPAG